MELEDGRFLELKALESEPNLWKIQRGEEGLQEEPELLGLIMTYVDDMFFVGEEKIVQVMIQEMRRCWKTSEPEMVGKKSIRFLGMDVHVEKNEETGPRGVVRQSGELPSRFDCERRGGREEDPD